MKAESSTAAIERSVPDIITDLAKTGSWAMTEIDPVKELKAFEAAVELQQKLIVASIRATKPQDWVAHGEGAYLQGTGAERLNSLWGLFYGSPNVRREDHPDGEFSYVVTGPAGSRRTGVFYQEITGGRSSADPFFDEFDEERPDGFKKKPATEQAEWKKAHRIPPDPLEVRKAAITNWQTRALSMLSGMRGLTLEDLKSAGIDVTKVKSVQYGTGAKGGDTVPAEVKADKTKLKNEVLRRAGGDKDTARSLSKDITKGKGFDGFDDVERLKFDWQVEKAWVALRAHPMFGDAKNGKGPDEAQDTSAMREPGEEG